MMCYSLSFEVIGDSEESFINWRRVGRYLWIPITKQMNNLLVSWFVLVCLHIFREALATCHACIPPPQELLPFLFSPPYDLETLGIQVRLPSSKMRAPFTF